MLSRSLTSSLKLPTKALSPSTTVTPAFFVTVGAAACAYQAILSSENEAERTSRSPSPSTSAAATERAFLAAVEMDWALKFWLPSFLYQAILLS